MLALFAEGIAGRPVHIKSIAEFSGDVEPTIGDGIGANHDGKAVFLPEHIGHFADEGLNGALYRLATLDELGFREFGTYRFDIETARRRVPWLAASPSASPVLRESDLAVFFHAFARPSIAKALFQVIETARIRAAVSRRYPGTRRYRQSLAGYLSERWAEPSGELAGLERLCAALLGVDVESRLFPLAVEVLAPIADVYTSTAATVACYQALGIGPDTEGETGERAEESTIEWLQREARLDDWEEKLADKDAEIAALEFAELVAAEETKVANVSGQDGDTRDVGAALVRERDQLKRRIDIERSSVRRALGMAMTLRRASATTNGTITTVPTCVAGAGSTKSAWKPSTGRIPKPCSTPSAPMSGPRVASSNSCGPRAINA